MWEEIQPVSDLWNWEQTPELEGELIEMNERSKNDGTTYMAYKIERNPEIEYEDGNIITILGSKILDGRLKKCEIGTKIKITYLGKRISGAGFEYRDFRVDKWNKDIAELGNSKVNENQSADKYPWDVRDNQTLKNKDYEDKTDRIDTSQIPF